MATRYWTGAAPVVQQVSTVQITADDAATTYTITINGIDVSVAGSGTGVNDTASALQVALDAATHVYFSDITWTVATDTVTGTGNSNGCPFTATSSVTGGTGTIGSVTTTTTAESPNHWGVADNWSSSTLPTTNDVVIFQGITAPCLWDLDQNSLTISELHVMHSYTGFIGHDPLAFTLGPSTSSSQVPEYRDTHLIINSAIMYVGRETLAGQTGAGRINLDNRNTGTPRLWVYNTKATAKDTGAAVVDYLVNDAQAEVFVHAAPGGVGIAARAPDDTATLNLLSVDHSDHSTRVVTGPGVTLTTFQQSGGNTSLELAADLATMKLFGGTCRTHGDGWEITDCDVYRGTLIANHTDSTRVFGNLDVWDGGIVDLNETKTDRTVATLMMHDGSELHLDDHITLTTNSLPSEEGVLSFRR